MVWRGTAHSNAVSSFIGWSGARASAGTIPPQVQRRRVDREHGELAAANPRASISARGRNRVTLADPGLDEGSRRGVELPAQMRRRGDAMIAGESSTRTGDYGPIFKDFLDAFDIYRKK
jgi:hypothetical protein